MTGPSSERTADAETLARLFHETYERLAPQFGYETRPDTAVAWEDVPEPNRSLMVAVASEVSDALVARNQQLQEALARLVTYADNAEQKMRREYRAAGETYADEDWPKTASARARTPQ